jgi:uncharacterized Zn-binding protein involved in type VI secretion
LDKTKKVEEIEANRSKKRAIESDSGTKKNGEEVKSIVYLSIPSYIYTKPNFEGFGLTFEDRGTKLTILEKKGDWIKVESEYFGTGWIQSNRVVADAYGFKKVEEKSNLSKVETNSHDENSKCAEIQRLSDQLMSLIYKLNFDKHNEISLKILSLMEELQTEGSEKQIPDCDSLVHLAFSKKVKVSFKGKGQINREDARIKYNMTAQGPGIFQVDFTVFPTSNLVGSYGLLIMTDVSCQSTHVDFNGVLRDVDVSYLTGRHREKWVNATQYEWRECPKVSVGGVKMLIEPHSSIPYTAGVKSPHVVFYSSKKPLPSYPSAYPFDLDWPRINLTEEDLLNAFDKGQLILKRRTEKKTVTGTVIIDFEMPDPVQQTSNLSSQKSVCVWGDRTTHGGFILATGNRVFVDGHPVAKEGDPVLCPIHGLSKVSKDETSGIYIGGKTVAVAGGKSDCGATILGEGTLILIQSAEQ